MKKVLIIVLCSLLANNISADSTPFKTRTNIYIEIYDQNHEIVSHTYEKSINIVVSESDTINCFTEGGPHHLSIDNDKFDFFSHVRFGSFKVLIKQGNEILESAEIEKNHGNTLYKFYIKDRKLELIRTLFNEMSYYQYFLSLLLTISIELFVVIVLYGLNKSDDLRFNYFILTFIFINIFTHFVLNLIYSHFPISIVLLELGVVLIESIYLKIYLKKSYAFSFKISFVANLCSWLFGGIILSISG